MKSVAALIEALDRGPAIVVPLVRQTDPAILKRRPAAGEWSIHENAVHLAEVHPLFFRRPDLMLRESDPEIKSYDPGRDEPEDALLKLDLDDALRRFADDRARLVARLRALAPTAGTGPRVTTNTTPTRSSSCSGTSRCTTSTTRTASRSCSSARTGPRRRRSSVSAELRAVDRLDVLVLVDNATDSLSTTQA